jgi:transposase
VSLQVLREIMFIETECKPRKQKPGQNNLALGDEENQENAVSTNHEERQNNSRDDHTGTEEISGQEREEQEAFLSLAQVICRKLNSEDLDDLDGAIQNASEQKRRDAFVNKLKMIIDDNSHATPDCLRIVKLCCQIALSVMRCEQYVEVFRNKGFMSSLSKAWATMCELESCMLFLGTDFGLSKNVGPLFSEINESFRQILHELY